MSVLYTQQESTYLFPCIISTICKWTNTTCVYVVNVYVRVQHQMTIHIVAVRSERSI